MSTRDWPEHPKWEYLPEQEVRESGLLAHINRSVLWPLGLALTVFRSEDGTFEERMRIQQTVPFDPIVGEGDEDAAAIEARMRTFSEWLAARLTHESSNAK